MSLSIHKESNVTGQRGEPSIRFAAVDNCREQCSILDGRLYDIQLPIVDHRGLRFIKSIGQVHFYSGFKDPDATVPVRLEEESPRPSSPPPPENSGQTQMGMEQIAEAQEAEDRVISNLAKEVMATLTDTPAEFEKKRTELQKALADREEARRERPIQKRANATFADIQETQPGPPYFMVHIWDGQPGNLEQTGTCEGVRLAPPNNREVVIAIERVSGRPFSANDLDPNVTFAERLYQGACKSDLCPLNFVRVRRAGEAEE